MLLTFGIFDRALDMIGLGSLLYWTYCGAKWWHERKSTGFLWWKKDKEQ